MSEQQNDMMAVLQKMQQQLVYLEKKLDTLLAQSRPSQPFTRPFRPAFKRPEQGYGNSRGPAAGHGPSHGPSGHSGNKKPYFGRPKDR